MPDEAAARPLFMNGLPDFQAQALLGAIPGRRSRRSYTGAPVEASDLEALTALAEGWTPWAGARTVVIPDAPRSLFMGIIGAYGGVSGSPSALAFVGSAPPEAIGYTGEAAVLAATARGLQTCWVAGVFSPAVVDALIPVSGGETVYAVSALGHATRVPSTKERLLFGAGRDKNRRTLEQIAAGCGDWPDWAKAAVSAARVAPSAMNRQPWRFTLSADGLALSHAPGELPRAPKRLDCGIAMLHAELGAFGAGVTGEWRLLEPPDVALFVPDARTA